MNFKKQFSFTDSGVNFRLERKQMEEQVLCHLATKLWLKSDYIRCFKVVSVVSNLCARCRIVTFLCLSIYFHYKQDLMRPPFIFTQAICFKYRPHTKTLQFYIGNWKDCFNRCFTHLIWHVCKWLHAPLYPSKPDLCSIQKLPIFQPIYELRMQL